MVIKENGERPAKAMNPVDSKQYILVKNHVRELISENLEESKNTTTPNSLENVCNKVPQKRRKPKENVTSSDSDNVSLTEVCKEDLEDLKTVYFKCKAIITKIEEKYGHLLNLNSVERGGKKRKLRSESHECSCILNKKIIFDEEGKQIIRNQPSDIHICPRNLLCNDDLYHPPRETINVTVEEEYIHHTLPDTIQELSEILKKPDISISFRNHVIGKIKYIRSHNLNVIRFDKNNLIEKIKLNPEDIFSFKGSNLSTLQGYPVPTSK